MRMTWKKKKPFAFSHDDLLDPASLPPEAPAIGPGYGEGGDTAGTHGVTLAGTASYDIFSALQATAVTLLGFAGSDIFFFTESEGQIIAGSGDDLADVTSSHVNAKMGDGNDMVLLWAATGTVDLGADTDFDIVRVWGPDTEVTIRNFDPERDQLCDLDGATRTLTSAGLEITYANGSTILLAGLTDDVLM